MQRRDFIILLGLGMAPLTSKSADKPTGLVFDPRFAAHEISPNHPEKPARFQAIETLLESEPLILKRCKLIPPWDIKKAEPWLSSVHSAEHIAQLQQNDPVHYAHALLATAGCLAAVEAVMTKSVTNAFCASRPPGHHATNLGREEGFCYFNHIAIAARFAQQHYGLQRILIVDWDYHHGNGTEWAFYDDDSVLFFSTHDQFAYPGTGSPLKKGEGKGHGFNINVHLDCGSGDKEILDAFENELVPVANQFKPDLILISAGFDSRQDDLLGCFNISDDGFQKLTQMMQALADKHCQGRLVSLLEGGYNIEGNAKASLAHLQTLQT